MNQKIQDAINNQIQAEMYSAHLYLAMSSFFEDRNLPGFAIWMSTQSKEEMAHAEKFMLHQYDRGGKVKIMQLDEPPSDFGSPLDAFKAALEHEKKVTGLINSLYELAISENDYPFQSLLKWFIDEQVEEEKSASDIIEKIKLAGSEGPSILMLDQELGSRKVVESSDEPK
ncbi:ferritin [Patescibacteria group bacterium]